MTAEELAREIRLRAPLHADKLISMVGEYIDEGVGVEQRRRYDLARQKEQVEHAGAQLVAQARAERDEMQAQVDRMQQDLDERVERAEAAVARVRELHQRDDPGSRYPRCTACLGAHWPCTTIDALDGDEATP